MKILISDIFFRKTYDVINILNNYYDSDHFIYALNKDSRWNTIKIRLIYNVSRYEYLTDNNFENDLLNISKKYSEEKLIFLPVEESTTLRFLNFVKKNGDLNFKYLLPSLSSFKLSINKKELNLFCLSNEIPCPKYVSIEDLKKNNFTFPIIKKPFYGSGSKGIDFIDNKEQLKNCNVDFNTDFLQERLPNSSRVEAGFFLCKEGEIISFYSHKRIRTFPKKGGVTVFSKSELNLQIREGSKKVLKSLNWSGFIMIEYIYDETDNRYKLIEINPRLWGSIMLSEFCNSKFLINYINICLEDNLIVSQIDTEKYIRWIFPYEILNCLETMVNPFVFFRKDINTCYINFTYGSSTKSFYFILFTYFKLKTFKSILKIV